MGIHFSNQEFSQRIGHTCASIRERGLDGMLLFAPESHYYLTGYDTFGYAMFQCMVVSAAGDLHLLTRLPDLRQARHTSILCDAQIHIWAEVEGANPYQDLLGLLTDLNLGASKLGIETKTVGLTAYNGQRLYETLRGKIELIEASDLISLVRRIKSPQEIEYHRKAAALSDDALDAAIATAGSGAFAGDILAAMQGAVFRGGGGYAGNEFIIGSGQAALLCRYQSELRHLDARDQMTLEWSGAYFRYHAAMMRTLIIGKANPAQKKMHTAAVAALTACEQAIQPGQPMGNVYQVHADILDYHGFNHARMQACGYGMGAVFTPIWVDYPMFYRGNPLQMQVGNVFFLHMILMDSDSRLAMCLGHCVLLTADGVERLSRSALDLIELA